MGGHKEFNGYTGWRAWALLALLLALNILNFADRTLPQAFLIDITEDIGLSYTEFTLINGPVFAFVYAMTGLAMGLIADRAHRPRLIAMGVAVWSIMTAATALARAPVAFAAARGLVAVGEATLSPSALSMIAEVFPNARRGTATSLYYLGISLGGGGAYLVAGSLGAALGWRACFMILGGLGLCLAAACLFLRDPREQAVHASLGPGIRLRQSVDDAVHTLRRSSALRYTLLAAVMIMFSQGASVLEQAWLVREMGFDRAQAQTVVGVVFLLGSLCGSLAGGPLADAFAHRWASGRLIYIATALTILLPLGFALRFADPASPAFLALLFAGSAGFTLFYGGLMPTVQDLSPGHLRATMIAVTLLATALLGTALGGVFAGMLADHFQQLDLANPVRGAMLATNAFGFAALPCLVLAARAYRRDRASVGAG